MPDSNYFLAARLAQTIKPNPLLQAQGPTATLTCLKEAWRTNPSRHYMHIDTSSRTQNQSHKPATSSPGSILHDFADDANTPPPDADDLPSQVDAFRVAIYVCITGLIPIKYFLKCIVRECLMRRKGMLTGFSQRGGYLVVSKFLMPFSVADVGL